MKFGRTAPQKISLKAFHLCKHNSSGPLQDFFSFHSGISSLARGEALCSYFKARDALCLQIPTNSSHTSLEPLQEESSAGLSQISHWVSSSFQGRNAPPAASALLGKTAHLGLFMRSVLLIKVWRKDGRELTKITMQKSCRAKRKKKAALRMFRNSLGSFGTLFFPLLWVVFTSPVQTHPGTDWAENCTIPAVEDGINISNWYQIHVLQPKSQQNLPQTCKHSPGSLPIHSPVISGQQSTTSRGQGSQQNVGADFYCKKGI